MTVFYRSDELAEMVGTWRVEAAQSPPIREGLERALAASDTRGPPAGGCQGAAQQGRHAHMPARRVTRRSWPPSTIWSRVLALSMHLGAPGAGVPGRCSSRASRTASATSPRRRWPPSAIWSRVLALAKPQTLQVAVSQGAVQQRRYARRARRVRGGARQPTTIWSPGFGASDAPWSSRYRFLGRCSTRASGTA